MELAQLAAGRAGELDLDRVDPEPASRIRLARPFRSADQGDGWRTYTFDPPSPVARVRQVLPEGDGSRTLGSVAMLRPGDAELSARRLVTLEKAGLVPTRTAGLGKLRGSNDESTALIARTADPRMLLAFQDGHVVAVLRELAPGAVTASLPHFIPLDALAAAIPTGSPAWLREVLTALEQDVPLADLESLAAAPRARLQALEVANWADLADEATVWDARFATADLTTRLAMMVEQAILLVRAFPDDAQLGGRALAWRDAGWNGLRIALETALHTGLDRGEAATQRVFDRLDAFHDGLPGHLASDQGRESWQMFQRHVAWERARLATIDTRSPFTSTRDELDHLLRSFDDSRNATSLPDSFVIADCTAQAARRLRAFAGDAAQSEVDRAWATALAEDLDAAPSDRLLEVRNDAATICGLLSHLATRIADIDHEVDGWAGLAAGIRGMLGDDRPPAMRVQATTALARFASRARALAGAASESTDRAALRAFTQALQVPELALATMAEGASLLVAARSLDLADSRPTSDRVAELEAFANQQQRFGPLAAMIAAELGVPIGLELARGAAQLSQEGCHARAAELLLTAASIGSAEGPPPKESVALRNEARTLRNEATRDGAPTPLLRSYWLHLAQIEALLAVTPLLPPLHGDDPLMVLQSRFVARQLGARAAWPLRYGLRLTDQGDVQRASAQDGPVRLGLVDDLPRWVPLDDVAPSPGPDRLHADPADWQELADMSEAVAAARDALRAVQQSRDLSRPEIEDRDRQLLERIHDLERAIERGQVPPLAARGRIDRLKREASALRDLLDHYTDRTRHVQARTNDYNDRVVAYNARLETALAAFAACCRELLWPATEAWLRDRIASHTFDDAERRARDALFGIGHWPDHGAARPAHPLAVAAAVRDATSPGRAADVVAGELELRLTDTTYNAGVPAEEHVARLGPAFEVFARDYGAQDFARVLLRGALGDRRPLHEAVIATLGDETLRDGIEKAR